MINGGLRVYDQGRPAVVVVVVVVVVVLLLLLVFC